MPLPLDNQLCFALYATSMAINRTYKPMLDEMGITYPQYLVLNALGEADGMSVGTIARRLALESSTVTPLVKRMEQAGLLTRQRSHADECWPSVREGHQPVSFLADTRCQYRASFLVVHREQAPTDLLNLSVQQTSCCGPAWPRPAGDQQAKGA